MAIYSELTEAQTDEGSPIDEDLMRGTAGGSPTGGTRGNFINHEDRLLALEASGGGGAGITDLDPSYAVDVAIETDVRRPWLKRYSVFQNILNPDTNNNRFGFDPEGTDLSRFIGLSDKPNKVNWALINTSNAYRDYRYRIPKSDFIVFRLKKGENRFGIGNNRGSGPSDSVTVTVDGASVTSLGLVDENRIAKSATYSTNRGNEKHQWVEWFYGLDPAKEQIIRIENTDSASKNMELEFIEVGFAPKTVSTDLTVRSYAGNANVRGTEVNTAETDITFSAANGHGHCGAIVADDSGTITAVDGIEGAWTQAVPEENIAFSSAVTSLAGKNVNNFPAAGGFCLGQNQYGMKSIFSYTSTTGDIRGTFNEVQWQNQPTDDYTPLAGFNSTTANDVKGDYSIALWAGVPGSGGVVSGSNNKLDFSVSINSTVTTHAATINNGCYSADLVPLGPAIIDAMNTAKDLSAINAEYFVEYDAANHLWYVGIRGDEADELRLLNNSGANAASSILKSLCGFSDTDLTGSGSYRAQAETESLAPKVYERGSDTMYPSDPRIKYNSASSTLTTFHEDIVERLGFGGVHYFNAAGGIIKLYPEDDCAGIMASFISTTNSGFLTMDIDGGETVYCLDLAGPVFLTSSRQKLMNYFIPFPRGAREITIRTEDSTQFIGLSGGAELSFVGVEPFYHKPAVEKLTTAKALVGTVDVSPLQLFETLYEAGGTQYTPQAQDDNIDSIAESGTWNNNVANTTVFNGTLAQSSTSGDTKDIVFTTAEDGGGVSVMLLLEAGANRLVSFYMASGGTPTETTSLVQNVHCDAGGVSRHDVQCFRYVGLDAGQYSLRIKVRGTGGGNIKIAAYGIIDQAHPQTDFPNTITDVNNTGQGVTYPIYAIKRSLLSDAEDRVPSRLNRTAYKEGNKFIDYGLNFFTATNVNEAAGVSTNNSYFTCHINMGVINDYIRYTPYCKSIAHFTNFQSSLTSTAQANIDGVTSASTFDDTTQVKGGSSPSTVRESASVAFAKNFASFASGDMSDSTTIPIAVTDGTLGMKTGMECIITADGQSTLRRTINVVTTDTSITTTEAIAGFANYTLANNLKVSVPGRHTLETSTTIGTVFPGTQRAAYLAYHPMDITPSRHNERRVAESKVGQVALLFFDDVATGADLIYPFFSDRQATWPEVSVVPMAQSSTASSWSVNNKLEVTISAGTMDFKVTAIRKF